MPHVQGPRDLRTHEPSIELVDEEDVRNYFDTYARALIGGDDRGVTHLWELPSLLMSDQGVRVLRTPADVARAIAGVRGMYTLRGVADTRPDIQRVEWLTERIVVAHVRWPLFDSRQRELGSASAVYTLARDRSGDLRLRVLVQQGEAEPLEH